MSVTNPEAANAALEHLKSERGHDQHAFDEMDQTRQRLEAGSVSDADPDDSGITIVPEEMADVEAILDGLPDPFEMREDRRAGSVALDVPELGQVRFGKPNGRASVHLDDARQTIEAGGADTLQLLTWLSHTLASWALDDDIDAETFQTEMGLLDALQTLQDLTIGGNARRR